MATVFLGTNRISNCRSLLALQSQSLLKIDADPLRLTLTTPSDTSGVRQVRVEENQVKEGSNGSQSVNVIAQESSVSIFLADQLLVSAVLLKPDVIHVNLDLRPLGINLFSDATGLHIGKNTLSYNKIDKCDTAIGMT